MAFEYIRIAHTYSNHAMVKTFKTSPIIKESSGDASTRMKFVYELSNRCGFSPAVADKLERDLRELSKKINRLKHKKNEIIYYAISDEEPPGKPLEECELIPVVITFFTADDKELMNVESTKDLKWFRAYRFTTEVRKQGALLNQMDLAFLLGVSPAVLQKLMKEKEEYILPTRGNICDMGPSISHADKIISLYLQGYTETQIQQRTFHSYDSIERYIDTFIKVVGLLEIEGLTPAEIHMILSCSRRLVNKYMKLYHTFNTVEYQWWMNKVRQLYQNRLKKTKRR